MTRSLVCLLALGCLPSYQRADADAGPGVGAGGQGGSGGAGGAGAGGATACDPLSPMVCPDGQKCDATDYTPASMGCPADLAMQCRVVFGCKPAGALPHGARCTSADDPRFPWGVDDCAVGTSCVSLDRGVCLRYCESSAQCADLGGGRSRCTLSYSGIDNLQTCTVPCSLGDATCPIGFDCKPILDDTATDEWHCAETGLVAAGQRCELDDCAAGSECFADVGSGDLVCRQLCDATHPCVAPATCRLIAGLRDQGGYCR